MRVTSLMAGLALVLAACGGEKKAENRPRRPRRTRQRPGRRRAAPAAAAAPTHDVDMDAGRQHHKFDPSELTIKAATSSRFHNKSGGPHNVKFWADSIPAGAAAVLKKRLPDRWRRSRASSSPSRTAIYTVSFTNAPAGTYKFYCLPHLALGMKGEITVQ